MPTTPQPTGHPVGAGRRIVVAGMSTLTAVVLVLGYHTSTEGALTSETVAVGPSTAGTSSGGTTSDGSSSGTTSDGSAPDTSSGSGGDSPTSTTVTGDVAQTRWGPVQVQLTTAGGQITDVQVVEYPQENGRDQQINSSAIPTLVQETLDAQGDDVDMVSGATVTSEGYLQSLQSALDEAGL